MKPSHCRQHLLHWTPKDVYFFVANLHEHQTSVHYWLTLPSSFFFGFFFSFLRFVHSLWWWCRWPILQLVRLIRSSDNFFVFSCDWSGFFSLLFFFVQRALDFTFGFRLVDSTLVCYAIQTEMNIYYFFTHFDIE